MAHTSGPIVRYYARTVELDGRRADEAGVRADLEALPSLLDHVEELLADGTLTPDEPNAATLQVLSTVRTLEAFEDLREYLGSRQCTVPARELFPRLPGDVPPFLPADWLTALG